MSTAFELQVYQNGQWQFDSYFDDKDTVVSEAERMTSSGRFSGVRVLQESYKENSNTCEYHVIFSRLGKDSSPGGEWRNRYQGQPRPAKGAAGGAEMPRRAKPRPPSQPKKKSNVFTLIAVLSTIVLVGIGAVIVLRSMAGLS
jgi:hypothetical protein